jgi:hypothetical protein
MRNIGFFMHNRGRYFVQQLKGGANLPPAWNFVAPSTNNGAVRAIIPDGAGGWYIGGTFTSITDSVATYTTGYTRLVRLAPDGKIDPAFSCPVNVDVYSLALDSTGLYLAGAFGSANSVGTATREKIARVRPFNDPSPGAVDAWNPRAGNNVDAIILDSANGKLYIGGAFTTVGGLGADFGSTPRIRIARVTTGASATLDAWRPDSGGQVISMALDSANGKLYFGGFFTTVGSVDANFVLTDRKGIARVTTGATAMLDAWRPDLSSAPDSIVLDSANGKLYIGGAFTTVGGLGANFGSTPRSRIARVTTGASAMLDAWDPNASGTVRHVVHDPAAGFVYLAGVFLQVSATTRRCAARVSDGATATLDAWDPNVTITVPPAQVYRLFRDSVVAKAIIVGNFSAVSNHADSVGNDIAGLGT